MYIYIYSYHPQYINQTKNKQDQVMSKYEHKVVRKFGLET